MEYIKENQILLDEELRSLPPGEAGELRKRALILFKDNIRLANSIAYHYRYPYDAAIDKEDVYQQAYLGLWKSCLGYDESKGYEFSTYATTLIRGEILRFIRDTSSIHVPRSYKTMRTLMHRYDLTLPLSEEEVMMLEEKSDLSRSQILAYTEVYMNSIDDTIGDDEDSGSLYDIIPDPDSFLDKELSEDEIIDLVDRIIAYMKPEYRDLVEEWMYSVLAGEHITQGELAVKYHRSQPHVGRILRQAIQVVQMHKETIRSLFGY